MIILRCNFEGRPQSLTPLVSFANEETGITADSEGWSSLHQLLGSAISDVPGQT